MPWADVRLNTEANFETSIEEKSSIEEREKKEDDRVSIPPFGWYRWANTKEANPSIRERDNLRLPPIRDGRKISCISFIITEEEMEEEKEIVTKKENETEEKNETKTEKIENKETKTGEEEKEEEEWREDIFSHSLAPSTFRLALASLPQGIEQTGRESR